jgi:hypothetical protein
MTSILKGVHDDSHDWPAASPRLCGALYTHRIAISDSRVVDIHDEQVTFRYKNYRETHPAPKTMTLSGTEFIRRFLPMSSRPASTASGTMAGSAIATAKRSSPAVANSSARSHRRRRRHHPPSTIVTDTRRSLASPCASVPAVRTDTCSSSSTWRAPTAAPRSSIRHEPLDHRRSRNPPTRPAPRDSSARSGPPGPRDRPTSPSAPPARTLQGPDLPGLVSHAAAPLTPALIQSP